MRRPHDTDDARDDRNPSGEASLDAVSTAILDDTGATSYVALVDSLEDQTIELDSAAEFPGWSSIATHLRSEADASITVRMTIPGYAIVIVKVR